MDAVEYHQEVAGNFRDKYLQKPSFRKRLTFWKALISKYTPENGMVLDLGCGPGWMTKALLDEKRVNVKAIDGAQNMLDLANQIVKEDARVHFIKGEITPELISSMEKESVDQVISSSVLEYVPNLDEVIESILNLLKPGGTFIFSIPNQESLFRKIESISYRIVGFPSYRKFILNQWNEQSLLKLEQSSWELIEIKYQGEVPVFNQLLGILPDKYNKPMLVGVLRKK